MVEKSLLLPHGVVPFHYDALSMTRLTLLSRFFIVKSILLKVQIWSKPTSKMSSVHSCPYTNKKCC